MGRPLLTLGAFAVSAALVLSGATASAFDDGIGRRLVEHYGIPATFAFSAEASDLAGAVRALCAAPSDATLATARAQFSGAAAAWGGVTFLRFGPLTEENRGDRAFFFPDVRGIGLRQIQALIADPAAAALTAEAMPAKSAALQGLPALEFTLFGTDADRLAAPGAEGRCAVARAIAGNLSRLAGEIAASWTPGVAFADDIAAPGAGNALYRSPEEVAREALKAITGGLAFVHDAGIGAALGSDGANAKPRLAPLWRSGATFPFLAAELDGILAFYDASGLAADLPEASRWLDGALRFEMRQAAAALRRIALPPEAAFADPDARATLAYVVIAVDSLRQNAANLAAALGLGTGFIAEEGGD